MLTIPIEVSARHIHLSQDHADFLFGPNYAFSPLKPLSQTGQYACLEEVEVQPQETYGLPVCEAFIFGKRSGHNLVRVLGPCRSQTQLELAPSDALALGIRVPVVVSGQLDHTPGGVVLIGPKGQIKLLSGIIIPQRHLHCNTELAAKHGLQVGEMVSVRVKGSQGVTFHNVIIRVDPFFRWHMHLTTDEGNAAGLFHGGEGIIDI